MTDVSGPPPEEPRTDEVRARKRFIAVLVLVLLVLFIRMTYGIIAGVVAGIVLWSMTSWMYARFERLTRGRRGAAAGLTVVSTILLFVIPAAVLLGLIVMDASRLADAARAWIEPYRPILEERLTRFAAGGEIRVFGMTITSADLMARLGAAWGRIATFVLALSQKMIEGFLNILLIVAIALYTQFFFCLDGDRFFSWVARLLPLTPQQSRGLIDDFFATARSTLKTIGILGAVQGGMGGLAFWVLGIPAPIFWTGVMFVASAIPSVGVQIIIVPAGILLILLGRTMAGVGLLVWGLVVIGSVDNLLRPVIVKRDIKIHELLILVSTLGGIATFGFVGLIFGPIVGALLKASLDIYQQVYSLEPGQPGP